MPKVLVELNAKYLSYCQIKHFHKENEHVTQTELHSPSLDMSVQLKICLATSKFSKTGTPSPCDHN